MNTPSHTEPFISTCIACHGIHATQCICPCKNDLRVQNLAIVRLILSYPAQFWLIIPYSLLYDDDVFLVVISHNVIGPYSNITRLDIALVNIVACYTPSSWSLYIYLHVHITTHNIDQCNGVSASVSCLQTPLALDGNQYDVPGSLVNLAEMIAVGQCQSNSSAQATSILRQPLMCLQIIKWYNYKKWGPISAF